MSPGEGSGIRDGQAASCAVEKSGNCNNLKLYLLTFLENSTLTALTHSEESLPLLLLVSVLQRLIATDCPVSIQKGLTLTVGNITLYPADLDRLHDNRWLNDSVRTIWIRKSTLVKHTSSNL